MRSSGAHQRFHARLGRDATTARHRATEPADAQASRQARVGIRAELISRRACGVARSARSRAPHPPRLFQFFSRPQYPPG
jgi:hypothetical protein